jgi:hypothetical protein
LLDHILEHLDLAEAYTDNAARIAALKCRSKHARDLIRRCRKAAERHRAEAAHHAMHFGIDPQTLRHESATWHRLRNYSLDGTAALTLADVRWLKFVARHGQPGSRNVRRAAELLHLTQALLGVDPHCAHWGLQKCAVNSTENFAVLVTCSPECT